jgi:hypothetical protein
MPVVLLVCVVNFDLCIFHPVVVVIFEVGFDLVDVVNENLIIPVKHSAFVSCIAIQYQYQRRKGK